MKQIIVNSNKYGQHIILLDDEDFDKLNKYKWHIRKNNNVFYAYRIVIINNKSKNSLIHREIMNLQAGDGIMVDHKDHNGLNNQKYNLRTATKSQNAQNSNSRINSSSKYLGVRFHHNNYQAQIKVNGKFIHLGTFNNEIDAAKAYNIAAIKHHGEFANINNV